MARDEFPAKIKQKLRERVGGRCSKPTCRVPTTGPSSDKQDKVTSIGVAAHIVAAAPQGPRNDDTMKPEQRSSIENGIWLCYNCSVEIDRDVNKYKEDLLHEWKRKAEASAEEEIGKKLPSSTDVVDTLTMALTRSPQKLIPTALSNVRKATEKALEELDPRFCFKISYHEGATKTTVTPRDPESNLTFTMSLSEDCDKESIALFRDILDFGSSGELPDVTFEGDLPKIPQLGKQTKVRAEIIPGATTSAIHRLWLVNKETSEQELFNEFHGSFSEGRKGRTFKWLACGQLFKTSIKTRKDGEGGFKIAISLNLEPWNGVDITTLPYLDKIFSFFSKAFEGWELHSSLEISGRLFPMGSVSEFLDPSNFYYLHYVTRCAELARALNLKIPFQKDCRISQEDYRAMLKAWSIVNNKYSGRLSEDFIAGSTECSIKDSKEQVEFLQSKTTPATFEFREEEGHIIKLFETYVLLPRENIKYFAVLPVTVDPADSQHTSDLVKINFVAQNKSLYLLEYLDDDARVLEPDSEP